MLLWFLIALLTLGALALLVRPLMGGAKPAPDVEAFNVEVYKNQLDEIDADVDRGLLSPSEAQDAKTEISRRLLSHAPGATEGPDAEARDSGERTLSKNYGPSGQVAILATLALIPAIAIPVYLTKGQPGLKTAAFAERQKERLKSRDINTMIAMVEERLRTNPDDGKGWDVLAPVYVKQQQFGRAADAYQNAIRILGPSQRRLMGFGEALVFSNNQIVSEQARLTFEQVVAREPNHVKARFWLALATEQDGKLADAVTKYEALLGLGSPNDPWYGPIEARLRNVRSRIGEPPQKPASKPATAPPAKTAQRPLLGPTAEDVKAAKTMAPSDRTAMIEGMVASLADRLGEDKKDLPGWQRLIQSYTVLGKKDAAKSALAKALKIFKDDPASLEKLKSLAERFELTSAPSVRRISQV